MGTSRLEPTQARHYFEQLLTDPRFALVGESHALESQWRGLAFSLPTRANINTDTYLAAFAIAGDFRLVTFDKGFSRFPGLDVEIIRP
jgi:predicted nucleic acid-binding protein